MIPHTPRRAGRPTKLTNAMRRRFLALVRSGIASTRVARIVGVCPDTVTDWCRANPDFSEALEGAREESLGNLEKRIHRAVLKDWRAAAWLLERKLPGEYARRDRLETTHSFSLESLIAELDASPTGAMCEAPISTMLTGNAEVHDQPIDFESNGPISMEALLDSTECDDAPDEGAVGNPGPNTEFPSWK